VCMGLLRVENRTRRIAIIQGTLCVLVLAMSYSFLGIFGIAGVGLAWLAGQTIVAALLMLTQLRPILRHGSAARK